MAGHPPTEDGFLAFRAGDQRCALDIGDVREVIRLPRMTRVPRAPKALLGLANLRGTVIPVFCAASLLGSGDSVPTRLIVLDGHESPGGECLGIAVDEASEVISGAQGSAVYTPDFVLLAQQSMPSMVPRRVGATSAAPWRKLDRRSVLHRLVVFALGNQEFALPVGCIERVLPLPAGIAVMPGGDAGVIGSATFGMGRVPVLSLNALLALPPSEPAGRPRVLVVRIGNSAVGLIVDVVRGIHALHDAQVDAIPLALRRGQSGAGIQAIGRLDGGERLIAILAPERLLPDDLAAMLHAGADVDRQPLAQDNTEASAHFTVFHIGGGHFAIPVEAVVAVVRLPDRLTGLPRAPACVQGLMNLRGAIVPVIDGGKRFGAQPSSGSRRRVMVVRGGERQAGFVVDAVVGTRQVAGAAVEPARDQAETGIFEGVVNLVDDQRIVLVVSPRELLDRVEYDLLLGLGGKGSTGGQ